MDAMLSEAGIALEGRPTGGPANSDAEPARRAGLRGLRTGALEALIAAARQEPEPVPVLNPLPRLDVPEGGWTVEAWWDSLSEMPRVAVIELDLDPGVVPLRGTVHGAETA